MGLTNERGLWLAMISSGLWLALIFIGLVAVVLIALWWYAGE